MDWEEPKGYSLMWPKVNTMSKTEHTPHLLHKPPSCRQPAPAKDIGGWSVKHAIVGKLPAGRWKLPNQTFCSYSRYEQGLGGVAACYAIGWRKPAL